MLKQLKVGSKACYVSIFCGLIACVITEINQNTITIKITARNNRFYKNGDIIDVMKHSICPRDSVKNRKYRSYIINDYEFVSE